MASISRIEISSSILQPGKPDRGPTASRPLLAGAVLAGALLTALPAGAFSQIGREDGGILGQDDIISAPLPPLDPDRSGDAPDWGRAPADDVLNDLPAAPVMPSTTDADDAAPLPVLYGETDLPRPVRDLRARLMEIARGGDVEALRPYLETGANATALSVIPSEEDPIETLKAASGDGEGVEILAILLEVLGTGHVRIDPGESTEIFIWPYFAQVSIEELTRPQLVELFTLVTAGDYQQMLENGAYYFYRVGISPDGRLEFFLAGD